MSEDYTLSESELEEFMDGLKLYDEQLDVDLLKEKGNAPGLRLKKMEKGHVKFVLARLKVFELLNAMADYGEGQRDAISRINPFDEQFESILRELRELKSSSLRLYKTASDLSEAKESV